MKFSNSATTTEHLLADFKEVIADAEALLLETAGQDGASISAIREKAEQSINVLKQKVIDTQEDLLHRAKAAAQATDHYVHENPWQALGVAASVGVMIGWLMGRR